MRIILSSVSFIVAAVLLAACVRVIEPAPSSAQIETAGMQALNGHQQAASERLKAWARQGLPVAQRELGLVYAASPEHLAEAAACLEKAANGGDSEAQFQLAEAYYKSHLGLKRDDAAAWHWYEIAATGGNANAGFMLSRMAKYGEGVPRNAALSVQWLQASSRQGNAQAMFLLSNAYAAGDGVMRDTVKAREWLERSAAGDYPVAIQALAMSLQGELGKAPEEADATRARHLIKEANDERLMHRSYQ